MITTTIWGGLGNQMFMYAMARATSLRNNVEMGLNLSQGFKDDKKFRRHLELTHFRMDLPTAGIATFDIPFGKTIRKISRWFGFNILRPKMRFMREKGSPEEWTEASIKDAYLQGFWTSEKYFKDYEKVIKKDFTIKEEELTPEILEELNHIKSLGQNIVMIGVRRYQECKKAEWMPKDALTADEVYYERAMDYMAKNLVSPVFVVFSQCQDWVKKNVDNGKYNVYYAKSKTGMNSAVEDLWLMTHCNHYIISHSTYYWWAAWLSKNAKAMVICPKSYNKDSICEGWIQM